MKENNHIVLATVNHPLFAALERAPWVRRFFPLAADGKWQIPERELLLELEMGPAVVWDFTVLPSPLKGELLAQLCTLAKKDTIFSDASCSWGELLLEQFPTIQGLFACALLSTSKFEFYTRPSLSKENLASFHEFFHAMKLTGIPVTTPGIGFVFPRTLSLLINEAHFALEEKLCSREDLNQAMKSGVNHPQGPLEWAKQIGEEKFVYLLDQLLEATGEARYRACPSLRLESVKRLKGYRI